MANLWVVPEELEDDSRSPHAYEACKAASYVLWAFSGRKYHGTRTVTERYECPCRSSMEIQPYLDGSGNIYNRVGGLNEQSAYSNIGCGCAGTIGGQHMRLRLRGTPVRSVEQVKRGDTVLDPSTYKVVNSSLLQLQGAGDVCGLEVTYTYGVTVPVAGRRAARKLASELVRGWSGEDCDLPDRVTNVSRQGISFTVIDPQDFLDDGRTGIYEVDLFLRAVNPDKARKPARVFSPDLPKAIRVTSGKPTQQVGPRDWQITPGEPATWTVDLASADADILLDASWNPQGQITSWNGATLLEFDPTRFVIAGGQLTVSLSAAETAELNGTQALWDLYAVSALDGYTIMHVLSSNIWLAG